MLKNINKTRRHYIKRNILTAPIKYVSPDTNLESDTLTYLTDSNLLTLSLVRLKHIIFGLVVVAPSLTNCLAFLKVFFDKLSNRTKTYLLSSNTSYSLV